MATSTVTITGNVKDMIDGDFDSRRTKVFLKHNTGYIVDADEGVVRLGSATVSIDDTGAWTLPDVIASADSVENLQATIYVDYADPMTRDRKRQSFGPYDMSAETGTVDITALEAVQHLDPSFVSVTRTEFQAMLDQAAAYLASQVDLSNISTPDALVEALIKNTGGAGPLTSAALTASYATLVPLSKFGIVGDGSDETTKLQNALASGEKLFIPPGFDVHYDGTLAPTVGAMIVGAGISDSSLTYHGSADSWAIDHDLSTDQYPGRIVLADFTLWGDGSANYGTDATVNGIRAGDDTASLANVPFYSLHRLRLFGLSTAVELEGYGHHIQETMARLCGIGYDLTHPEQAMVLNSWADYCDVGLQANVRKSGFYGHRFHVIGGAFQRCNDVGIWLQNLYEPNIDTYFELNGNGDVRLGDPADPSNYTKGIKNGAIKGTFSGSASTVANVDAYASNSVKVVFDNTSGPDITGPHVRANGYCKNWEVQYGDDSVHTSYATPFEFQGNSALTSWAHPRSGRESVTPTLSGSLVDVTVSATSPLRYYKSAADEVTVEGSWTTATAYSGGPTIFTLPVGYRPLYQRTYQVATYTGSWGTAIIQVNTDGTVKWQSGGGNSRTVYLGTLRFRTGQTAY